MSRYAHLAFTENVRRVQEERGSATAMTRLLAGDAGRADRLGADEAEFIEARDGFYLGTVSETGWPYIQFRGGPPGFVHVLDAETLAFVDVRGNRQYITAGNIRGNDRVSLFFMDYAHRTRLKVFGRAEIRDPAEFPDLVGRSGDARTDGHAEWLLVVRVEGLAWNCPQHITPRFSESELSDALEHVYERLVRLEKENLELRSRLGAQD
ncbi:pyridoxamine 5-phosphate oxidase [Streptomyces sp. PBH53]|uniref:pyridoxamine 5'-phosphate oxidase family protein n=1 Tax=Streptomyces TaxID=1883 RepID=UPI000655B608|nr:pyridoxamine 5'-phosphate oxidase family protein [Streptomyces sp. PBH53]AKN72076.1 pyridoxamine 5-phosphate oxidase [Streptomyces sp. PBH53]